jgi:hypothetical protein
MIPISPPVPKPVLPSLKRDSCGVCVCVVVPDCRCQSRCVMCANTFRGDGEQDSDVPCRTAPHRPPAQPVAWREERCRAGLATRTRQRLH